MNFDVGDTVKVRVTPEVDPDLWDDEGLIVGWTNHDEVLVELSDGTDVTLGPESLELVAEDAPSLDPLFGV